LIDFISERAPAKVLERYLKSKRQLRVGADKGPYNAGPLWIWTYLVSYKSSEIISRIIFHLVYFYLRSTTK
jgi:hypothetical protein